MGQLFREFNRHEASIAVPMRASKACFDRRHCLLHMTIPTEPIGSIPRPLRLIAAISSPDGTDAALDPLYDEAIRDTIAKFEETGSPVITDGEQRKYHNFWTYCVHGLPNMAPDGFKIPFSPVMFAGCRA